LERDEMRVAVLVLAIWLCSMSAVLAQGYVYQPSGLDFVSTTPVEAGQTVRGLVMLSTGMLTLGDVAVQEQESDDMFTYWRGTYNRGTYYYDIYSGYWKPGPVEYKRAFLNFKSEVLEGWTRVFGGLIDYNHFFSQDGVLYKRVNIERNRHRKTNKRRKIVYTYFVNMETGERSDSGSLPYLVIGDVDRTWLEEQMRKQEDLYRLIVREDPAFPNWRVEAYEAPSEVVVANGQPDAEQLNLLQLIEQETGTVKVEGEK
jgi:hypothetical protein